MFRTLRFWAVVGVLATAMYPASAAECLVGAEKLNDALKANVKASGGPSNGGFDSNEWAVVIARDGTICAVAHAGNTVGDQWPASCPIAAEKANTANGTSLPNFAIRAQTSTRSRSPGAISTAL